MTISFLAVRARSVIKAAALSLVTILALAAAKDASATPVTYDFLTGTASFPQNESVAALAILLTGGVSGMFTYPALPLLLLSQIQLDRRNIGVP